MTSKIELNSSRSLFKGFMNYQDIHTRVIDRIDNFGIAVSIEHNLAVKRPCI